MVKVLHVFMTISSIYYRKLSYSLEKHNTTMKIVKLLFRGNNEQR